MHLSQFLALATVGLAASLVPASAATLLVPQQFPTIQKAVNAAKPGDTVLVTAKSKGGVYNEAVTITTPNLVLQGQNNPILDGTGLGKLPPPGTFPPYLVYPNGIEIRASHIAVRGLTVQNTGGAPYGPGASAINVGYVSADGLTDVSFSDVEISNVIARNNYAGVTISGLSGKSANAGGTPKMLKNYSLLNDVFSGSTNSGASVLNTSGALISGSQFMGNGGDGLDTSGTGINVTGNEAATNTNYGMALNAVIYNPAVNDPKNPNPTPSTATFNSIHDNVRFGLSVTGTQTISANALTHNTDFGMSLEFADYSTITLNAITGTTLAPFFGPSNDGTGLIADSGFSNVTFTIGGNLTISGNEISGNAGDGIFLSTVVSSTVSLNDVTGNAGIGIHLSDYNTANGGASQGYGPNTVTQNHAVHNTVFDARDDASAPDTLNYDNYTSVGDGSTTINIWTKNQFGTTDPKGLSK